MVINISNVSVMIYCKLYWILALIIMHLSSSECIVQLVDKIN